ncbi:MAG: type II toxin-antitoxin system PemK/MazF family toxin [Spiribacter salinus]|uniref:Type II toxin-antitoxin system PemK/MazF family toxin n=1 Tax=Spiribacter salinus TaxID=1335746 RepID=A0A540VTS7_9GAMM|nr:MAG: type II toxin-antitoxin system PemK/MazF family toxin [Spiribacter salinus]
MKRGDLVTVAVSGAYGKPRPAVIIQSDYFDEHPSVTVLPITTHLRETPLFRVMVDAGPDNNLRSASQVMVDKAVTVPRDKVGEVFGALDATVMLEVDRSVALFLGIAK